MLRYALVIAGLTLFTVAGWVVIPALGMAVAGLSCLIFEWIIKDGAE
jgi:phosphate/sulfate permease